MTLTAPGGATAAAVPDVARRDAGDPVFQAYTLLRIGFTVAPIMFGLDKFARCSSTGTAISPPSSSICCWAARTSSSAPSG